MTKVKLAQKQAEGIAEARSGRRSIVGSHSPYHFPAAMSGTSMIVRLSCWKASKGRLTGCSGACGAPERPASRVQASRWLPAVRVPGR